MSSCACVKCQNACRTEPGIFMPNQIATIERIDKRLLHQRGRQFGNILVRYVTPATTNDQVNGTCVFFKNGRCDIYDNRPYECAQHYHTDTRKVVNRRLDHISRAWLPYQAWVRAFFPHA